MRKKKLNSWGSLFFFFSPFQLLLQPVSRVKIARHFSKPAYSVINGDHKWKDKAFPPPKT